MGCHCPSLVLGSVTFQPPSVTSNRRQLLSNRRRLPPIAVRYPTTAVGYPPALAHLSGRQGSGRRGPSVGNENSGRWPPCSPGNLCENNGKKLPEKTTGVNASCCTDNGGVGAPVWCPPPGASATGTWGHQRHMERGGGGRGGEAERAIYKGGVPDTTQATEVGVDRSQLVIVRHPVVPAPVTAQNSLGACASSTQGITRTAHAPRNVLEQTTGKRSFLGTPKNGAPWRVLGCVLLLLEGCCWLLAGSGTVRAHM